MPQLALALQLLAIDCFTAVAGSQRFMGYQIYVVVDQPHRAIGKHYIETSLMRAAKMVVSINTQPISHWFISDGRHAAVATIVASENTLIVAGGHPREVIIRPEVFFSDHIGIRCAVADIRDSHLATTENHTG